MSTRPLPSVKMMPTLARKPCSSMKSMVRSILSYPPDGFQSGHGKVVTQSAIGRPRHGVPAAGLGLVERDVRPSQQALRDDLQIALFLRGAVLRDANRDR